jgi:hypothetical protein
LYDYDHFLEAESFYMLVITYSEMLELLIKYLTLIEACGNICGDSDKIKHIL